MKLRYAAIGLTAVMFLGGGRQEPPGVECPLELRIEVVTPQESPRSKVTLRYLLTNRSESSVGGCINGWGEYTIRDGEREVAETLFRPLGWCPQRHVFMMPPKARLEWEAEVRLPADFSGDAEIAGVVGIRSIPESWMPADWAWTGVLTSEEVPISLTSGERDGAGGD